ncbi:hypothetical protein [Helicobacter suis]|uniref:hypothetical protein n=1 Tax=Helicobacter suis TaxID=104628 RepID=UPI0013D70931|nr:hypothetical protein [Helicobacter suis]
MDKQLDPKLENLEKAVLEGTEIYEKFGVEKCQYYMEKLERAIEFYAKAEEKGDKILMHMAEEDIKAITTGYNGTNQELAEFMQMAAKVGLELKEIAQPKATEQTIKQSYEKFQRTALQGKINNLIRDIEIEKERAELARQAKDLGINPRIVSLKF